jgi:hypothetical protein
MEEPGDVLAPQGLTVATPSNRFLVRKHQLEMYQRRAMLSMEKPDAP